MRIFRRRQDTHAYAYALRALGLAAALGYCSYASTAVALGFESQDYLQRVDGVPGFTLRGESVFLARKYSIRYFLAPYALIDEGYVLASESTPNRAYEIDASTLLQSGSWLPNPLPKHQLGLATYAFGYMLWELLAFFIIALLLAVRLAKRRATPRMADAAGDPSLAAPSTLLWSDSALASETDQVATGKVWLLSESGMALAAPFEHISSPAGCIVGRAPASDVVIADKTVSKRHARLSFDSSRQLVIEDLESANGSWKNGTRISREVFSSGDAIWFGNAEFKIDIRESQETDTAPIAQTLGTGVTENNSANEHDRPLVLSGIDQDGHVIQFWLVAGSEERVWTLGRKSGAADLVIANQRISAIHAQIRYRPGCGFEICDLGSANGTKTDGQEVGQDYVPLTEVRKISFGEIQLNANLG